MIWGKISLIFGVIHMSFGVLLSVWNKVNQRQYHSIILEFFPQIIFLVFIFGYLIFMIFLKWIMYGANKTGPFSEHCAPNLLITFINMMLFKAAEHDKNLEHCKVGDQIFDIYMFSFQETLQKVLVITGVLMIPVMLLGKPLYILNKRRKRRAEYEEMRDDLLGDPEQLEEGVGFGEIMINQGIHTIEYVLGSISHTASYLRLWALSLAHNQLSEVLWSMVLRMGFTGAGNYFGIVMLYLVFAAWAAGTIAVMVLMEGLP